MSDNFIASGAYCFKSIPCLSFIVKSSFIGSIDDVWFEPIELDSEGGIIDNPQFAIPFFATLFLSSSQSRDGFLLHIESTFLLYLSTGIVVFQFVLWNKGATPKVSTSSFDAEISPYAKCSIHSSRILRTSGSPYLYPSFATQFAWLLIPIPISLYPLTKAFAWEVGWFCRSASIVWVSTINLVTAGSSSIETSDIFMFPRTHIPIAGWSFSKDDNANVGVINSTHIFDWDISSKYEVFVFISSILTT